MNAQSLRRLALVSLGFVASAAAFAQTQRVAALDSFKRLSLEELMSIKVSSVSRRDEAWFGAPGGIDVLSGDDIRRIGALNLTDALRVMAGVNVSQPQARSWGIGMRGFTLPGGNKINAQIDGRALFTPFYSGIFWDAQDVLMEDIDRIEEVRGPVGALWGAYSVNGLIQIFTKSAWDTQGSLITGTMGTDNAYVGAVRYGGMASPNTAYRVYFQYRGVPPTFINGERAEAASDLFQAGFRSDTRQGDSTFTLQGDAYTNDDSFRKGVRDIVKGANLTGRWQRVLSHDRDVQVVGYFDYTGRTFEIGLNEERRTFQLNARYHALSGRHELIAGTDNMLSWDTIGNIPALQFDPNKRTIGVVSGYLNYTYEAVPSRLKLIAGAKVENNSFSGFEIQPSVRAAWTPTGRTTIWAAISRAVRTPVRFDHDTVFPGIFVATDDFKSEQVLAFEVGARQHFGEHALLGMTLFHSDYNDLRSYQPLGSAILPLTFGNYRNATIRGVETSFLVQPANWLQFRGNYRYLYVQLSEDPGARDIIGPKFELNDPRHIASLTTRIDVRPGLDFDLVLRGTSATPFRNTPGYITGDAVIRWSPNERWEWALIGRNLARPYQIESIIPQNDSGPGFGVPRIFALRATHRY